MSEFSEPFNIDPAYAIEPEWTEKETPIISSLEYMEEACHTLYERYNEKLLSDSGEMELTDEEDEELHTDIDKEIMKISDYFQDIASHYMSEILDPSAATHESATIEEVSRGLHTLYTRFEKSHIDFLDSEDLRYEPEYTDSTQARTALQELVKNYLTSTNRETALEEIGFYYLDHLYRTFPVVPNYSAE